MKRIVLHRQNFYFLLLNGSHSAKVKTLYWLHPNDRIYVLHVAKEDVLAPTSIREHSEEQTSLSWHIALFFSFSFFFKLLLRDKIHNIDMNKGNKT